MKGRYNRGLDPRFYFYQETGRTQVDLIYPRSSELVPIEIKSSKTFDRSLLKGLENFRKIAPDRCSNGYLIYSGNEEMKVGTNTLINYKNSDKILDAT